MKHPISRNLHRLNVQIGHLLESGYSSADSREVTGTNARIIQFLAEHPNDVLYQKDIEKAFGITRSTASRVLSLMEEKNQIQRRGVHHDARLKQVTLTDHSLAISQAMREAFEETDERLVRGFTEAEKEQLMQFLKRMQNNLE